MTTEDEIRRKYEALSPLMDERMRRYWAGIEADVLGEGGIAIVERATGMRTDGETSRTPHNEVLNMSQFMCSST